MNKQQFWLSDYFIDLSRNQITYKNNTSNLQPKVMAVLHVLARQQGQVVSFESLMAEVWPNTVVTSNTLQRCISQLRKVFNDSQQEVIRTHAKSGYSLEIPIVKRKIPRVFLATRYLVAMLCVLTIVLLINFLSHSNDENHHAFSKVSAVTNTDDNESGASYSPSGRYIAYLKNINACESEIWLKDTTDTDTNSVVDNADDNLDVFDGSNTIDGYQLSGNDYQEDGVDDKDTIDYSALTNANNKIVIDLAGVMDKITTELIEEMAPLLTNPLIMAVEKDNENLRKKLRILFYQ